MDKAGELNDLGSVGVCFVNLLKDLFVVRGACCIFDFYVFCLANFDDFDVSVIESVFVKAQTLNGHRRVLVD